MKVCVFVIWDWIKERSDAQSLNVFCVYQCDTMGVVAPSNRWPRNQSIWHKNTHLHNNTTTWDLKKNINFKSNMLKSFLKQIVTDNTRRWNLIYCRPDAHSPRAFDFLESQPTQILPITHPMIKSLLHIERIANPNLAEKPTKFQNTHTQLHMALCNQTNLSLEPHRINLFQMLYSSSFRDHTFVYSFYFPQSILLFEFK